MWLCILVGYTMRYCTDLLDLTSRSEFTTPCHQNAISRTRTMPCVCYNPTHRPAAFSPFLCLSHFLFHLCCTSDISHFVTCHLPLKIINAVLFVHVSLASLSQCLELFSLKFQTIYMVFLTQQVNCRYYSSTQSAPHQ